MKDKIKSVGIGLGLAMLGAGVTYLVQWSDAVDFGDYDLLVAGIVATVANVFRKVYQHVNGE